MRRKLNPLEYAVYLIGRRGRTRAEIRWKLLEKKYPEDEINMTLARLDEINLLDDRKFAEAYTTDKVNIYRRGRFRIGLELLRKGVDKEIIDQSLSQVKEEDELKAATSLLEGRRRSWRDLHERKRFERAMALLQRRGFSPKVVRLAIQQFEE